MSPRLVILRALGLGDLLTAVPALRALADAFPDHRRILAAPAALEPLVALTGAVHEVVDAAPLAPLDPRLGAPDVAVNLHGAGPESHRLLLALRPARLIAFAHPDVPASAGGPAWHDDEHEVARWCRLLAESGVPADPRRLDLPAPAVAAPPIARGATVLHPGAAQRARWWGVGRWAAVARAERRAGRQVVVTGGPGELDLARAVARRAGLSADAVLAGRTDVLALAAVVAAAARLVSADTGVAHLATALGTPSVTLFGPTPPGRWGPPSDRPWHRVLWSGRPGDPRADRPDPGLRAIRPRAVREALATLPSLAPPVPRELQVEVTAACNLRCRMCLVRYRPPLDRVAASMPLARFARLVDALPGLEKVTLQGLGEPLLAPDLVRMVAHAAARGIRVGFNTNATLLTRERAARLVDAGVDWLHVSVDGAAAATYEGIRDGARFARVAEHVAALASLVATRGGRRPRLALVCVAMRRNVAELPALVRQAAAWGIRDVRVQNLSHDFADVGEEAAYAAIRAFTAAETVTDGASPDVAAAFDAARTEAAARGVRLRLPALAAPAAPRAAGTPGCDWPWRSAYVRHDGGVQPCCMLMGDDRGVLGRLDDGGLAAVWHGPAYRAFRARLLTDTPPDVCRGCAMYRGVF